MSDAYAFARPPLRRPRIVGDTLVLGQATILAQREVVNGCWMLRQPDAAVLAALLSVAYEKPIAADDRLTRTVLRAIAQMQRNPRDAEQSLSDLPDPCAAPETLDLAARLLASGIRPEALAQAMRRAPLGLQPQPVCAESLTLCDKGVVLGQTVVIPLADRPGGATGLDLAGREGRILALLSIGRLGVVPPETLGKLHAASAALERGEAVLAAFHLALLGQPPLPHRNIVKALDLAVAHLDGGFPPYDLLKALELLPQGMRAGDWRRLVKYRPDQLRDDHGRWAEEGAAPSSDRIQVAEADIGIRNDAGQGDVGGGSAASPEPEDRAKVNTQKIIDTQGAAIDGMSKEERLEVLEKLAGAANEEIASDMRAKLWEPFLKDKALGLTVPLKGQEVIDTLDKMPIVHEIRDLFYSKKWDSLPVSQREEKLQQVVDAIAQVYGLPPDYHIRLDVPSGPNRGAEYTFETHLLVVSPTTGIGEYAPNLFAVIAHEMTHAWQDQQIAYHCDDNGVTGLRARIFRINNADNVYIDKATDPSYNKQPLESQAKATDAYIRTGGFALGYMWGRR